MFAKQALAPVGGFGGDRAEDVGFVEFVVQPECLFRLVFLLVNDGEVQPCARCCRFGRELVYDALISAHGFFDLVLGVEATCDAEGGNGGQRTVVVIGDELFELGLCLGVLLFVEEVGCCKEEGSLSCACAGMGLGDFDQLAGCGAAG